MSDELEQAFEPDRRTFIKRLVVGTVFAAPVVSSFTMSGVEAVFGATPGRVTAIGNPNTTTQPGGLTGYPTGVQCFPYSGSALDETMTDGAVTLRLQVPAGALPPGSIVCVYKGDLATIAGLVPANQTPVSAYAVVWNSPPGNSQPNATSPLTLTVTDPAVANGNPIFVFDKGTGAISGSGTASGSTWVVTFVVDPGFFVSRPGALVADAPFTG